MSTSTTIRRPDDGYWFACLGKFRDGSCIPDACQPSLLDEQQVLVYAYDGNVTTHVYHIDRESAQDLGHWYTEVTLEKHECREVSIRLVEPDREISRAIDAARTASAALIGALDDEDLRIALDHVDRLYDDAIEHVGRGDYGLAATVLHEIDVAESAHGWTCARDAIATLDRVYATFPSGLPA